MSTERNVRVQARYDELMREGKHGHYETLFRVVNEEVQAASALRQSPETRDIERGAAAIFEAIPDDCELVRGLDPTFRAEEICTILARACLASVSTPSPEGPRDDALNDAVIAAARRCTLSAVSGASHGAAPTCAHPLCVLERAIARLDIASRALLSSTHLGTSADEENRMNPNIESSRAKEGE